MIFLDQLGADPEDERIRRACEYVLAHSQARNGGFGASGVAGEAPPQHAPERLVVQARLPTWYVADVLQNLEVLAELGHARDPRLANAVAWLLGRQDAEGRWANDNASNGKTWVNIERRGQPSKWVTLRACSFLRSAFA